MLVAEAVARRGNRLIDRWERPTDPDTSAPLTAYTIFTTGDDLTPAQDSQEVFDKVAWLPPPTTGEVAFFNVSFVRPTGAEFELRGMIPIFAAPLKTKEVLLVTASRRAMTEQENVDLQALRADIAEKIAHNSIGNDQPVDPSMRILRHAANAQGGRYALDLSAKATLEGLAEAGEV